MSSSARPNLRLESTVSSNFDLDGFASSVQRSRRRNSDLSLIIQTDLPSPSSPDSFHTSETTVSSDDQTQQSSSSASSLDPPGAVVAEVTPQRRPTRRSSRTFPSLISRISSAAAGGAHNTALPTHPAQQVAPEAAPKSSRPVNAGPKERPVANPSEKQPVRSLWKSQQAPGVRAPFEDSSTALATAESVPTRQPSEGRKRQKDGQRRQLTRTVSTRSGAAPVRPSGNPDDDEFANERKMHQTSSRLLRMTDDDRPYTRVSALSTLLLRVLAARNY